jgi:hypothetical protein
MKRRDYLTNVLTTTKMYLRSIFFCAIALVATAAYNYAGLALSIVGIAALSEGE